MNTNVPINGSTSKTGFYQAARVTAMVAAIFVVVVSAMLLIDYGRRQWDNPFESDEFIELKKQLAKTPQNEKLKEQIRVLDLDLRREFFRQQRFAMIGAHLLLLGVIVLVAAEKTACVLLRRLPSPEPVEPSVAARRCMSSAISARWAATVVIGVVAASAALATFRPGTQLPTDAELLAAMNAPDESQAAPTEQSDDSEVAHLPSWPSDEEIAKNWPYFRGPHSDGVSKYKNIPTTWDAASGKNILWKTPVPLPGNNSPVVWGNRIFLAGADRRRREVYCFDAASGELLWTREAPSTPQSRAKTPKVEDDTGLSAPTMATDGHRAYAIFANGDVVAVDFTGKVVWSKSFGIPKENMYGYAASLAMYQGRLFIQWDEGMADDKLSKMISLDAATGKPAWQVGRPVTSSWSSPIVIRHADRDQLITASDPLVIAYDPASGKELWRAEGLTGDQGVTPILANGLIQVGNEYSEWLAIRPDGSGDVTKSHIIWRGEDGLPDTVSPLVTGDNLLLLTTSFGIVTCYDAAEGEMLWDHDFDTPVTSSPTLIGGRVFMFAKNGRGFVFEATRDECKIVSETNLGERCVTSPAVQDGRLYIRTKKHLVCIGEVGDGG